MTSVLRKVLKVTHSPEMSEGVGAKVHRGIGTQGLQQLDPFLLFDEGRVRKPSGFFDHPHRGFETVTYVLGGAIEHEDFLGNRGVIREGDLQWMTAGKGIVHAEVPHGNQECWVTQLWVNLKAEDKFCQPNYQELTKANIPKASRNGVHVTVLAGECLETKAAVFTHTPINYLDFKLDPSAQHEQFGLADWNVFVYVIEGNPTVSGKTTEPHDAVQFHKTGNYITIENKTSQPCRLLYIAGEPIKEPVFHRGPFALATERELLQTFDDYNKRTNGFERAKNWHSAAYKERYM